MQLNSKRVRGELGLGNFALDKQKKLLAIVLSQLDVVAVGCGYELPTHVLL